MKIKKILTGIEYQPVNLDLNTDYNSIEYDSRHVENGAIFVCIKGYETDGHQYIGNSIASGAKLIVLDDETYLSQIPETVAAILVSNSRQALSLMSANFYENPAEKLKIIGVTGTNGKTSVTYLLKKILTTAGHNTGVIGTINIQINEKNIPSANTTPESKDLQALFREMVDSDCEYCVMEVSSHSLYLDRVFGIPFAAAIFTNLSQDHLDFHKTMEQYLDAKKILFTNLNKQAPAIINSDDSYSPEFIAANTGKTVTYGIKKQSTFMAQNIELGIKTTTFDLKHHGDTLPVKLELLGEFSVYNSLAAISTAHTLGIDLKTIISAITDVSVNGRFQVVESNHDYSVVIDYAHTPDGLLNITKTANSIAQGKVILLFGCGGDRDPIKRPIMGEIAGNNSDYVIITSDNPRTENPNKIIAMIEPGVKKTNTPYTIIENRKDAISFAINMAEPNDIVILAGKGHEDYQIIEKTKYPFSDFDIAQEAMNKPKIKIKNQKD